MTYLAYSICQYGNTEYLWLTFSWGSGHWARISKQVCFVLVVSHSSKQECKTLACLLSDILLHHWDSPSNHSFWLSVTFSIQAQVLCSLGRFLVVFTPSLSKVSLLSAKLFTIFLIHLFYLLSHHHFLFLICHTCCSNKPIFPAISHRHVI